MGAQPGILECQLKIGLHFQFQPPRRELDRRFVIRVAEGVRARGRRASDSAEAHSPRSGLRTRRDRHARLTLCGELASRGACASLRPTGKLSIVALDGAGARNATSSRGSTPHVFIPATQAARAKNDRVHPSGIHSPPPTHIAGYFSRVWERVPASVRGRESGVGNLFLFRRWRRQGEIDLANHLSSGDPADAILT